MPCLFGKMRSLEAIASFTNCVVTSSLYFWSMGTSSTNSLMSATHQPFPSISNAPSIWFAAKAPPHINPSGKPFGTLFSIHILLTLSGASAFMTPAVCRFANFLRGWADAVMIGFYLFSNASIRASKWLEILINCFASPISL